MPKLITLSDIKKAREVISSKIHRTNIMHSTFLSHETDTSLYLKLELFQKTGSFKVRGVSNKLASLRLQQKNKGVISLSAGNHAQAVAWAASQYSIPATLIMPSNCVQSKRDATQDYGGEVITTEENLLDFCLAVKVERDLELIHPFDDLKIIAGHATAGVEILEDMPDVDYVIVGVGGGGLISGISTAIKLVNPKVKVIGVEPEGAPTMTRSVQEGKPVHLNRLDTIADGLAAPFVGQHNLEHVGEFVDDLVLVSDEEIRIALKTIWQRCKVLAEPAAASAVAALLADKVSIPSGAKVVCLLSGGNIDFANINALFA